MPKIYELLGYPVSDNSPAVVESRKKAFCPFIADKCDGGGNRYMSDIDLKDHPELEKLFPGMSCIPSGVCSVQITDKQAPWIICPRRLLYMGKKATNEVLNGTTQTKLLEKCSFPVGTEVGIWAEVKVRYTNDVNDVNDDRGENSSASAFDYTFDYVLMPLGKVTQDEAVRATGMSWQVLEKSLRDSGHTFAMRDGKTYIEDFPTDTPVIVEVMTSSTSGGSKKKRSCIPQAFEDCMLGKPHMAPGINYRQVWARMSSQLIVKSQPAMAWGGKTIWVLQDLLADYISTSTALDLRKFVAEHTDEVNILAFSYGNKYRQTEQSKTVSLDNSTLYAGPIKASGEGTVKPCFQDIVLTSVCPPESVLITALSKKALANRIVIL